MRPKIYVASPLGFSEAGAFFYEKNLLFNVRLLGFEIIDPWKLTPKELIDEAQAFPYGEEQRRRWQELNTVIGRNNRDGIDRSDMMLAVLDGTDVDSGTASEVGYAYGQGKLIIGYRGDFRLSADNVGSIVNLQVEFFIRDSSGDILTKWGSALDALAEARKRWPSDDEDREVDEE